MVGNPKVVSFEMVQGGGIPILLIRPMKQPGEGMAEYITRLCFKNKLNSFKDLVKIIGLPYRQLLSLKEDEFRSIINGGSRIVNIQPAVNSPAPVENNAWLKVRIKTRVCPQCLKECAECAKYWGWPLSISCGQHNCLLLDACPQCGSEITHERRSIFSCNCGYDFRSSPAVTAPEWIPTFYKIFSPWRSDEAIEELELIQNEYRSLAMLFSVLAPSHKQSDSKLKISCGRRKALLCSSNLRDLDSLISNWPNSFCENICSLFQAVGNPAVTLLTKIRKLNSQPLATACDLAQEEILKLDLGVHSVRELCRITGLSEDIIRFQIEKGAIPAASVEKRGWVWCMVPVDYVNKIRKLYEDSISLKQAAEFLECNEKLIIAMVKVNAFKVEKFIPRAKGWRFDKSVLSNFITELQKKAKQPNLLDGKERLVPIGQFSEEKKSSKNVRCWKRFIGYILSSKIEIFSCPDGKGLNSLAIRYTGKSLLFRS